MSAPPQNWIICTTQDGCTVGGVAYTREDVDCDTARAYMWNIMSGDAPNCSSKCVALGKIWCGSAEELYCNKQPDPDPDWVLAGKCCCKSS